MSGLHWSKNNSQSRLDCVSGTGAYLFKSFKPSTFLSVPSLVWSARLNLSFFLDFNNGNRVEANRDRSHHHRRYKIILAVFIVMRIWEMGNLFLLKYPDSIIYTIIVTLSNSRSMTQVIDCHMSTLVEGRLTKTPSASVQYSVSLSLCLSLAH